MNGTAAVLQLLRADAGVIALVEDENIVAGRLTLNTSLDALGVEEISAVYRPTIAAQAVQHVSARIQVTIVAANLPRAAALAKAVKHACHQKYPTVAGISDVVVLSIGRGPDFGDDPAKISQKSHDFGVSYNEPA